MFNVYRVQVDCSNDYSRQMNFTNTHLIAAISLNKVNEAIRETYNFERHDKLGSKLSIKIELLHVNRESYVIR